MRRRHVLFDIKHVDDTPKKPWERNTFDHRMRRGVISPFALSRSAVPQPHHHLPHLDAIANNNGGTTLDTKTPHNDATGIPKVPPPEV